MEAIKKDNKFITEQEVFWAGEFGNNYINRNNSNELLSKKTVAFSNMLRKACGINSCIEFGANIGLNLLAIRRIMPNCNISGIEINTEAKTELEKIQDIKVYHQSILEYKNDYKRELAFVSGVLIHINPDYLDIVYEKLYNATSKYILISEYFNPTPVEVNYRGHKEKLFKRDFPGEVLDKYSDLKLIDYGFFIIEIIMQLMMLIGFY